MFDLESKTLHLPADYRIHSTGSLTIASDKHLLFNSGRTPEEREGYLHSIWFNADLDEQGRPIREDDTRYIQATLASHEECCDD